MIYFDFILLMIMIISFISLYHYMSYNLIFILYEQYITFYNVIRIFQIYEFIINFVTIVINKVDTT